MRKVKKFNEGGSSYTGDDEIVKYRMGQTKDPGIDLFKLTSGEAQEAKPAAKTRSIPAETKAEPAKPAPAKPAEVKTEVKTTSEDIFDETGAKSKFKRNQETGELYTLDEIAKPAKPVKPASNAKPAEKSAANVKPAKTETKAETKAEPKKPYDSNAANAAIKAQSKLDSEYTPPKPPPSPGRLGFRGDFFSGRPYGSEKFEKEQRSKKSMAAEGNYRKGGVTKMAGGGKVKSASARADGCAIRGKTRA